MKGGNIALHLSYKKNVQLNNNYSNIIGHMCYAAYKLWNVCNYERKNYKEIGLLNFPNWYYQKKEHKNNLWYKQLPSQSAQEVCKILDKGWKSYFRLKETKGIENPKPPRFKQEPIAITYMQNGIKHDNDSSMVKLTLSKELKDFMSVTYGINDQFIYLENKIFKNINNIKQIKIYPPKDNVCDIIIIYEIEDVTLLKNNNNYLSIDIGLHNLLTCYHYSKDNNNLDGNTFIVGRKYLAFCNYYYKEIARVQSEWYKAQNKQGVKYPKTSKHIQRLYKKKNNIIHDYLHKVTNYIVQYCLDNNIHIVVIGDITNIRKDKNFKDSINQKLHSLPYKKIYELLEYKLTLKGIRFIKVKECYSSQVSPLQPQVSKKYATKNKRIVRGLFKDGIYSWNADCVGAFNILRLFFQTNDINITLNHFSIKTPTVIKVAV